MQIYTYTGANEHFVKASLTWLAIGSSAGHYGLYLDAELNHGRTQRCATFDNDLLTDAEDFQIAQVEAWGFSMDEQPFYRAYNEDK